MGGLMRQDTDYEAWMHRVDRRKFRRVQTSLNAVLLMRDPVREIPCVVANLSSRGAGIR